MQEARPRPAQLLAGYALMVVTALGWAGAWITARLAAHDAPPLSVTVGRYLVAALALVPAWLVFDRHRQVKLERRDWALLIAMAAIGINLYTILFLNGVQFAPASDGAILTPGLAGLFGVLLVAAVARKAPGGRALAGSLLALTGCFLVGWSALQEAGLGSARVWGDVLFVACAATWGLYTLLNKRATARIPAITAVLLASVLGVLMLAPVALVVDGVPDLASWSGAAVLNVVYLGVASTAVALVTYYLAVKLIGVERIAPTLGLVPIFAVTGAAWILDEALTVFHAAGALLVVLGITLPGLHGRRRPVPPPAPEATRL
jgi:drug/metabolite transporter (DMT)-like permease